MVQSFLVVVDDSKEFPLALQYAAARAKQEQASVAFLTVVEAQGIEAWGGVERAMDDEAFDRARVIVAGYAKQAEEETGQKPLAFYKKGEMRTVLLDLIDQEKDISALVLAAGTGDGGRNPLIQYLTSDKGLRKLNIPLIIVPDTCRCREEQKG